MKPKSAVRIPCYRVLVAGLTLAAAGPLALGVELRTLSQSTNAAGADFDPLAQLPPGAASHPMMPALKLAADGYDWLDQHITDYTCTIIRRERIGNKLIGPEYIAAKIRHGQYEGGEIRVPFSVYVKFLGPKRVVGREALYVEGQNAGKILVRRGGERFASFTTYLDPAGRLAMKENRYPMTDTGFKQLVRKLIEVMREELQFDPAECQVQFFRNAKVGDRVCTRIRVQHSVRRPHYRFYLAEIYIDDELNVPIRFASYDWPSTPGGEPKLLEEYAYVNVRLNVGLTDRDFDRANPAYKFAAPQSITASAEGSR